MELGRVLVATDGSAESAGAVEVASWIANQTAAEARFAQVWSLDLHHRHGWWDTELRQAAERSQSSALEVLRSPRVRADAELLHADAAHVAAAVAEAARHYGADLMVVGTRGLGDWRSLGVAYPHAPADAAIECPVMLVRGKPSTYRREPLRVMLAIADQNDLERTIDPAIAAASSVRSTVLVVQAGLEGWTSAVVDQAVMALHQAGIEADGWLLHPGAPGPSVVGAAARWQPDILVLGPPLTCQVGRALFAPVIDDLLRQPPTPALVA